MIYLIKGYGDNKVLLKIGFTEGLAERLKAYKTHTPDFELLKTREGDQELEQDLHYYFKEFKYNNEWLVFNQKIIDEFDKVQPRKRSLTRFPRRLARLVEKELKEFNLSDPGRDRTCYLRFRSDHLITKEDEIKGFVESFREYINRIPDNVLDFLNEFYKLKTCNKLKFLCIHDNFKFSNDEWEIALSEIPEFYRNVYIEVGPERCKALGYNYSRAKVEYETKFFNMDILRNELNLNFPIGLRITSSDAKNKLREIYNKLGYNKSPKATDLGNFFELKETKVKDKLSGKFTRGYEILKQK